MPQLDLFAAEEFAVLPAALLAEIDSAKMPALGSELPPTALSELLDRALFQTPMLERQENQGALTKPQMDLCLSGLWLLAGDLDQSHAIRQQLPSQEGSFWHGIMHRREGDFGNAKYWFRKVGDHPVIQQLPELTDGVYDDPYEFVDLCSRAVKQGGEKYQRCQWAQWIEWQALMVHCLTHEASA